MIAPSGSVFCLAKAIVRSLSLITGNSGQGSHCLQPLRLLFFPMKTQFLKSKRFLPIKGIEYSLCWEGASWPADE
jgi:hypothetical protein